jgi:hypothetical protein
MGAYYRRYASEGQAADRRGMPPRVRVRRPHGAHARHGEGAHRGFAPNCGITYRTRADAKIDPLFHPLEAGVCKVDPMIAQTRLLERAGGDLNSHHARPEGAVRRAADRSCSAASPSLCTALGAARSARWRTCRR